MELHTLTIAKAHELLTKRQISSQELTEAFLTRIAEANTDVNAYLAVTRDLALAQAKEADEALEKGIGVSLLTGIPLAIKDNILVEGIKCTAASRILEPYVASYDATVVTRLKKAGAVFLGKTNMDEFAMGSSTEHSAFGPTKNPSAPDRVPGGSSGGSAAAVAADLCAAALGSDTGGSIRQPASFCGIVGLKPTYGRVSRSGLIAMASSLDQIGPMTKTTEDCALLFSVISGYDPHDATTHPEAKFEIRPIRRVQGRPERIEGRDSKLEIPEDLRGVKVGMPKEYFVEGIDSSIRESVEQAINELEKLGAELSEVSLPHTKYALATYYLIMPSEVSANLARFDGIRYGYSTLGQEPHRSDLWDIYFQSRQKGFGDEVRRRIMLGTYALSAGYYDAYYLKAQKVRAILKQDFERVFDKVDILAAPTSPVPPFKFGERLDDPLAMYLADVYTVSVNLAGLPALSMPCGQDAEGLPVGLQLIGKSFGEELLFKVAGRLEASYGV